MSDFRQNIHRQLQFFLQWGKIPVLALVQCRYFYSQYGLMTDFLILLYTSTSEIPSLSNTWSLKTPVPFRGGGGGSPYRPLWKVPPGGFCNLESWCHQAVVFMWLNMIFAAKPALFLFVCFFHRKRNPLSKRVNKRRLTQRTSIKT